MAEPGEDGTVLPKIPTKMHERHALRKFLSQLRANHFAIVLGTVIYQNDLERCEPENRCDALDKRADGATAVINRDH
jgi:hypothetical protein